MAAQVHKSQDDEPAPGFASPHEEALLTLLRTADWLQRALQQRLRPFGLTATQFNVLRILRAARPRGLPCSAIGSRMITSEPDITRLLARLKAQKLVSQHRDPQDRRVVWTRITASGLDLLAHLDGRVELGPRELLRELGSEEIRDLTRLLRKARSGPDRETPTPDSVTAKLPLPRSLLPPRRPE